MDNDDEIRKIMQIKKLRKKFIESGIYQTIVGPTGPTGPTGKGLDIKATYNTLEELKKNHPIGNEGDSYIVDGELYIWDPIANDWINIGNIKGPTGESEKIIIGKTTTTEPENEAKVIETKQGLNHILDFVIPQGIKGEQGPTGLRGEVGPTGPKGEMGPIGPVGPQQEPLKTSYDVVFFGSYAQAHYSKTMNFQDTVLIPENSEIITTIDNEKISIKSPGYYEITLCGQISGVDQNHSAIFHLSNSSGSVIQDLSFQLQAGTTTRMDCSETVITKIEEPTNLHVTCGITGDTSTAKIDFANVNIIIKKYNV